MRKEVKNALVVALMSGNFSQAFGGLKRWDSFCPLGILCELHRLETGKFEWQKSAKGFFSYAGVSSFLPTAVRDWAGLRIGDLIIGEQSLTYLNDHCRLSLPRLAELAERWL